MDSPRLIRRASYCSSPAHELMCKRDQNDSEHGSVLWRTAVEAGRGSFGAQWSGLRLAGPHGRLCRLRSTLHWHGAFSLLSLLLLLTLTLEQHSMLDVTVGSVMGILVWLAYYLFQVPIEAYTRTSGLLVTLTFIPSVLFLVFVHPAPAEDCPCFEDAVAFLSVVLGIVVGRNWYPVDFLQETVGASMTSPLSWSVWLAAVLAKLIVGELRVLCDAARTELIEIAISQVSSPSSSGDLWRKPSATRSSLPSSESSLPSSSLGDTISRLPSVSLFVLLLLVAS